MRDIKFRAWNESENKIAKVSTLHHDGDVHVSYKKGKEKEGMFFGGNWVGDDWKKENVVLEQYTGLKDKNGKEIYEGDIVEFHGNYTSIDKCGRGKKGVVTWDNEHMGFCLMVDGLGAYDVATETDEWHYKREVIGNIHENKELLNS